MMLPESLKKELEPLGVVAVYLFGSSASGSAAKAGDLDFAFLVKDASPSTGRRLTDELYLLFSRHYEMETDLVILNDVSLPLQFEIINTGKVLFDGAPLFRVDFEEQVMLEYLEFLPFLEAYEKSTLETFR